jgi:hypothetical protein
MAVQAIECVAVLDAARQFLPRRIGAEIGGRRPI